MTREIELVAPLVSSSGNQWHEVRRIVEYDELYPALDAKSDDVVSALEDAIDRLSRRHGF